MLTARHARRLLSSRPMAASQSDLDQIFQAPLDQFTATRDRLTRELRRQGKREAAAELGRVRKPSLSAWALNQLQRRHPKRVAELLAAGSRLRETQEALLAGGEPGRLRDAAARERELVGELVQLAVEEAARAGNRVGPAIQTRIHETLHAAAGSEEARELLASGRLQHDYQLGDLGLLGTGPPASSRAATQRAKPDASRKLASLERRLERERERRDEMQTHVSSAETALREAQDAAAKAATAAEQTAIKLQRAQDRLAAAAARVLELEAEVGRLR
jgi:hypothetical protein